MDQKTLPTPARVLRYEAAAIRQRAPSAKQSISLRELVLALSVASLILWGCYKIATFAPSRSQPALPHRGQMVRLEGSFGCTDRAYHSRLVSLVNARDERAFNRGLEAGVAAGVCTVFRGVQLAYVEDTDFFADFVQVRPQGEVAAYWVIAGAVIP